MTWQEIAARSRQVRSSLAASFPRRAVLRVMLVVVIAGFAAIVVEAIVRAHLDPPGSRVATTLYSRADPWRAAGVRQPAIASMRPLYDPKNLRIKR